MEEFEQIATALASDCDVGRVRRVVTLRGGGNNRVCRVEADRSLLLKLYFKHPGDKRNRLESEFIFSCFAWNHGVRRLPRPLACDPQSWAGLYEFVDGGPLALDEVTEKRVGEALDFFCEINAHRSEGIGLPIASEACFSISQHLECVERRIQTLRQIERLTESQREAIDIVESRLVPAWQAVADAVDVEFGQAETDEEIPLAERCLSPSDFGFHNAICGQDGQLRFIDFEYAGWDDPAKLVCDFFCQPAHPVPRRMMTGFIQMVCSQFGRPESLSRRITALFPVYQIKWCCILLNEFLPAGGARRRFADEDLTQSERERWQLEKVRHAVGQLCEQTNRSEVISS